MRHCTAICSTTLLALATTSCCALSGAEAASSTIIVTADRSESDDWRTTASTSTVTAEDIRLIGTPDAWTAPLRTLPGVDLINSAGGLDGGGLPTLRLRGTASNADNAVLVDGIPWSDATSTATDPQLLGVGMAGVESIEVVGGPQSGLYGSRALGGVVNVRSLQPTEEHEGRVRASAGSFGTRSVAASATGPLIRTDGRMVLGFALAASALESDGISSLVAGQDGDSTEVETDRLWRTGVNARVVHAPSETVRLHAGGWIGASHYDYDSAGPDDEDSWKRSRTWRAVAGGSMDLPGGGGIAVDLARTRTHREQVNAFIGTNDYASARLLTPVNDFLRVQIGLDLDHQQAAYEAVGDRAQSTAGTWAQALVRGAVWEATAVLRYDDFSTGKDPVSWKGGGAWLPDDRVRVHGSVGMAYRAPSLDERFSVYSYIDPDPSNNYLFSGNPDLGVQSGLGWDVGISARPVEGWEADLTAFGTHYDQRIVRVSSFSVTSGTSETLVNENASARTVGIEAGTAWRPADPWWSRIAITYQDSKDEDGRSLALLPDWKAAWLCGWRAESWWATATVWAVGSRHTRTLFNDEKLDGYFTVDLATGYAPRPWLEIVARVENLTQETYVTHTSWTPGLYYSGIPRAFSVAVEARY